MNTQELEVTPEQAQIWLQNQAPNRGLSNAHVNNYAHAMRTGRFSVSPGGISFDQQGRLRDGQHRLKAVIQVGVPQVFRVHTNCTEAELAAIDQGRPRTVADAVRIADRDEFACNKTPVARLFISLELARNVKISESVFRDVAEVLGPSNLDTICRIPRAKVSGPVLAALVYAYPCFPKIAVALRDKMAARDGSITLAESEDLGLVYSPHRNVVLEAMIKCQNDKLKLHHDPTTSLLKFMRAIEAFIQGERLVTLQETRRGYEFLKEARARRGFPVMVAPTTLKKSR